MENKDWIISAIIFIVVFLIVRYFSIAFFTIGLLCDQGDVDCEKHLYFSNVILPLLISSIIALLASIIYLLTMRKK